MKHRAPAARVPLCAVIALSGAAAAQPAPEPPPTSGSLLRSAGAITPAPVVAISRDQLDASGVPSLGEFLQQLPQQGGALNTQVNSQGDGQTQMNLRNIGSKFTLVLVDGKRMVKGGVGAGSAVDLNAIPTASVERIEVVLDGASALYGSDAIGGVVNVVTRKRIDGVQLNAYGGTSQHRGASVYDVNLLAGAAGDRGNFLLGAGYFDQQPLLASGRGWAASPVSYDFIQGKEGTTGSSTLPNVRVNGLDPGSCPTQLCRDLATTFGAGQRLNFIYDPAHTKTGVPYVDGWRLRDPSVDLYNYQAVNYLVTPSQRVSLFGNGEYRLADFARAYLQASYVQRDSRTQAASEPFVTTGNPDLVVAASNPYNPFGVNITSTQRRLIEVGERAGDFDVSTARIVAGFDGTIGGGAAPLGGWSWDVFLNYGRTAGSVTTAGTLNTQITGVGFGPGYVDARGAHCGTPAAPIFNCTPVNLFGPPGSIDPEMVTQLGAYSGTSPGTTQLFVAGASLTGEPFRVAADSPAALTIGFEHRNEYGTFTNQPVLAAGFDSDKGSPGPADVRGGFYANEVYAELMLPLISHARFTETFEIQLAARLFNYSTSGFDWTYKMGARLSPTRALTLRATYSTAYRAPGVADLFLGQQDGFFESSQDPCADTHGDAALADRCRRAPGSAGGANAGNNGITVAMINSVVGGNPSLQPETAKVATAGVVLEPLRGLSMAASFYAISVDGLIGAYGTQLVLNKCYGAGGVPQDTSFCQYVTRDPTNGAVTQVVDINMNVASVVTQGIDFGARYTWPTNGGRFTPWLDGTYLLAYEYTDPSGLVIQGAGNYDGQGDVTASGSANFNPRVKFNAGLLYELGGLAAQLVGHFTGSLTECSPNGGIVAGFNTGPGFCYQQGRPDPSKPPGPGNEPYPAHTIPAQLTLDAMLAYRLPSPAGTTTLAAGIRNLLDQAPPRIYDSSLTYADPHYDFRGRFVYGRVEHKF